MDQDRELVTSDPGDEPSLPEGAAEALGDLAQHGVADEVPERVVDLLEADEIDEKDVTIGHEASVSKVGEDQLFYLMSRGISEDAANAMVVSGFIEPIAKELLAEYSIELYRLVQLQMEGSVG